VKTRQVAQLIFEIPLADFDAAYDVLGGLPDSAKERWFGIAPISSQVAKETQSDARAGKRDWRELQPAQQAGIRCDDPIFIAFLKEQHAEDWEELQDPADFVRSFCNVSSRSELQTDHKARVLWHQLDEQFLAWREMERIS
jgi:hypothetical protein